jgi:hypothetical protein
MLGALEGAYPGFGVSYARMGRAQRAGAPAFTALDAGVGGGWGGEGGGAVGCSMCAGAGGVRVNAGSCGDAGGGVLLCIALFIAGL